MQKFRISAKHYWSIIDHARQMVPVEACGVIAGKTYAGQPPLDRLIRMDNVAEDWGYNFEFDPEQQMAVWNDLEMRGEVPIAIYHSHTRHEALPSPKDIQGAEACPEAVWIIAGIIPGYPAEWHARAFSIRDGIAEEVELEMIEDE